MSAPAKCASVRIGTELELEMVRRAFFFFGATDGYKKEAKRQCKFSKSTDSLEARELFEIVKNKETLSLLCILFSKMTVEGSFSEGMGTG